MWALLSKNCPNLHDEQLCIRDCSVKMAKVLIVSEQSSFTLSIWDLACPLHNCSHHYSQSLPFRVPNPDNSAALI